MELRRAQPTGREFPTARTWTWNTGSKKTTREGLQLAEVPFLLFTLLHGAEEKKMIERQIHKEPRDAFLEAEILGSGFYQ